jgi:hypothetical protein
LSKVFENPKDHRHMRKFQLCFTAQGVALLRIKIERVEARKG